MKWECKVWSRCLLTAFQPFTPQIRLKLVQKNYFSLNMRSLASTVSLFKFSLVAKLLPIEAEPRWERSGQPQNFSTILQKAFLLTYTFRREKKGNSKSHSLLKLLLNLRWAVDNILFCLFGNWSSVDWFINIIQAFLCLSWELTFFFLFPLVYTKKVDSDFTTALENWNSGMKNMLVLRNIYIYWISEAKAFLRCIQKMEIYRLLPQIHIQT